MSIETTFYGGFPRGKNFISLYSKFLKNDISREEFYKKTEAIVLGLIRKLSEYDVKIGTDGIFIWDDIFAPFSKALSSVEANGLYRFFDNNFYLRIPVVKGKISYEKCITCDWYRRIINRIKEERIEYILRAVLPGYALFAFYSDDKYYNDKTRMLRDYHKVLLEEIESLRGIGIEDIELHDPALLCKEIPSKISEKSIDLYKSLNKQVISKVWVITYFRYSYFDRLESLIKDTNFIIHIDLVENSSIMDNLLSLMDGGTLSLGIVDARNTKLEKVRQLKTIIEKFREKVDKIYIAPNTFMEFIPERIAYRKVRILSNLSRKYR